MKILIVEDDENKRTQLETFFHEKDACGEIVTAKSFCSAIKAVGITECDLIVLDMSMPTYDITIEEDGGRPQHYAGREIMRQLDRRGLTTPVIVVTQLDVFGEGADALTRAQLQAELEREHGKNYLGTVYYNPATDGWKADLLEKLAGLYKLGR